METHVKLNIPLLTLREKLRSIDGKNSEPSSPSVIDRKKKQGNPSLPSIRRGSSSTTSLISKNEESSHGNLRDVSYRLEILEKIKPRMDIHETKLNEVISGVETELKLALPTDIETVQKEVEKLKDPSTLNDLFLKEIDLVKLKISRNKLKRREFFIKESLYYFKTQSEFLNSQIPLIYESPKAHYRSNSQPKLMDKPLQTERTTKNRGELDLGAPTSRREVELLSYWLDYMIDTHVVQAEKPIDLKVNAAQLIYTLCFKEIIRQVSVHCLERGNLMEKVWNSQLELYSKNDDRTLSKLEEMQGKHLEYMKCNQKDLEQKLDKCQSTIAELTKIVRAKDKTIDDLNSDKRELRQEIEKIRQRINDMNETINSPTRKVLMQKHREVQVTSEFVDKTSQTFKSDDSETVEESEIHIFKPKAMRPVIIVGYFDLHDMLHAQQIFRRHTSGRMKLIDLPDELIVLVTKKHKATNTGKEQTENLIETLVIPTIAEVKDDKERCIFCNDFTKTNQNYTSGHSVSIQAPDSKHYLKIVYGQSFDIKKRPIKSPVKTKRTKKQNEILASNLVKLDKHINKLEENSLIVSVASQTVEDKNKMLAKATQKVTTMLKKDRKIMKEVYTVIENELVDSILTEEKNKNIKVLNDKDQKAPDKMIAENIDDFFTPDDSSSPAKLIRRINKFKNALSRLLRANKSSESLTNDEKAKKYAHKLRIGLESMYPVKKEISSSKKSNTASPVRSPRQRIGTSKSPRIGTSKSPRIETSKSPRRNKTYFTSSTQTDMAGNNIFMSRVENISQDEEETKDKFDHKEKSFLRVPRIRTSLNDDSNLSSYGLSLVDSKKPKTSQSKTILKFVPKLNSRQVLIADAFLLGQIQKKIHLTHPGQKYLLKVMSSLREDELKVSLSLKALMKILNQVYSEKTLLSRENSSHKRHEACVVLYDMLIHKYGLRSVSENKYKQVILATIFYSEKYPRVQNFYKFLGLEASFNVENWNFYLNTCEFMEYCNVGAYIYNEDTSPVHYFTLDRALQCASTLFEKKLRIDLFQDLLARINLIKIEEPAKNTSRMIRNVQKNTEKVNTDVFLGIMIEFYTFLKQNLADSIWIDQEMPTSLEFEEYAEVAEKLFGNRLTQDEIKTVFEDYSIHIVKNEEVTKAIMVESFLSWAVDNNMLAMSELV